MAKRLLVVGSVLAGLLVLTGRWIVAADPPPPNLGKKVESFTLHDPRNQARFSLADCKDKKAMLNLLAVEFDENDPPGGVVTLIFSGDAALRLEVECLECELVDLGPVWTATCCPAHAVEADDARIA